MVSHGSCTATVALEIISPIIRGSGHGRERWRRARWNAWRTRKSRRRLSRPRVGDQIGRVLVGLGSTALPLTCSFCSTLPKFCQGPSRPADHHFREQTYGDPFSLLCSFSCTLGPHALVSRGPEGKMKETVSHRAPKIMCVYAFRKMSFVSDKIRYSKKLQFSILNNQDAVKVSEFEVTHRDLYTPTDRLPVKNGVLDRRLVRPLLVILCRVLR